MNILDKSFKHFCTIILKYEEFFLYNNDNKCIFDFLFFY